MWRGQGQPDRRNALFGGSGEVRVWSLLDVRGLPPFAAVLGCELDPSGSVGPHVQQQCSEIVVITEGEGVAQVSGASIALRPGVVVPLPFGSQLALQNSSASESLRYLIVKALPPAAST